MPATRRLAAILAADVAGYSRLMGADEGGTHERLKAHRRELVDPKIAEHSGRIVKTTGDGVLAEFPSVGAPDARRCGDVPLDYAVCKIRYSRSRSPLIWRTRSLHSTACQGEIPPEQPTCV